MVKNDKSMRGLEKSSFSVFRQLPGFTLLETLLSAIIAVMILTSVTMVFLNIVLSKQAFLLEEELQYSMRFAMQKIRTEIKAASGVDQAVSLLNIHPGKLVLTFPTGAVSPRILQGDGQALTLKRGTGSAAALLPSRVQVKNFVVAFAMPSHTSGLVTGTLTLQSALDPRFEKTETFTMNLLTR